MTAIATISMFVVTLCLVYLEGQGLPRAAALIIWLIGLVLMMAILYQEDKEKKEKKRKEQLKEYYKWERRMKYHERDIER